MENKRKKRKFRRKKIKILIYVDYRKNMQYVEVNLTKDVQDLYGENSKMPQENMKKMHALSCDRKDQ